MSPAHAFPLHGPFCVRIPDAEAVAPANSERPPGSRSADWPTLQRTAPPERTGMCLRCPLSCAQLLAWGRFRPAVVACLMAGLELWAARAGEDETGQSVCGRRKLLQPSSVRTGRVYTKTLIKLLLCFKTCNSCLLQIVSPLNQVSAGRSWSDCIV